MNIGKTPAYITIDLSNMLPVEFDETYKMPIEDKKRHGNFDVFVPIVQYEKIYKLGSNAESELTEGLLKQIDVKKLKKEDCFIIFQYFADGDGKNKKLTKSSELICIKDGIEAFNEMFVSRMEDFIETIDEE